MTTIVVARVSSFRARGLERGSSWSLIVVVRRARARASSSSQSITIEDEDDWRAS